MKKQKSFRNRLLLTIAAAMVSRGYAQTSTVSSSLPDAPAAPSVAVSQAWQNQSPSVGSGDFPTAKQQFKNFLYEAVGPGAFIGAAIGAGTDQGHKLKDGSHPEHGLVPEWGVGAEGYSKRYGSRFGAGLVSTSTKYGLDAVLGEDETFHLCDCSGVFPRAGHAVFSAFTARTRSGRVIVSAPAFIGPLAGGQVAVAGWFPSRYGPKDGLRYSLPMFIGVPVGNLIREFTTKR